MLSWAIDESGGATMQGAASKTVGAGNQGMLLSGRTSPGGTTYQQHQNFILDRVKKFDAEMLKQSKRNEKLMTENINLRN